MAYGTVKVDAIQSSTKTVQVDDLAESADLGTAATEDVGTSAGNVVQLDGSARLPAVDGSQLTNLPGAVMDLDGLTDVDLQTTPPADGEALVYDGVSATWIPGAAGATAAGSANEIQYNDGSSGLAASADLTWDDTAKELGVGGDINLDDGGTYSTTLQMVTATANRTISFPDATGTVALVAGSSGQLIYNSAGANAGTPTLTYDGSILTSSGRFINSYNATASSPAKAFTGTWFTGGTATTTKPQVLIEPSGTTSTAWSTSGTGLGVNAASGFSGNLLDLQVGGASRVSITSSGDIITSQYTITANDAGANTWNVLNNGLKFLSTLGAYVSVNVHSGGLGLYPPGTVKATGFSSAGVNLYSEANDIFAQRRGTNAQTYRLYNTYTDASNYQRTSITDDSTGLVIDQQYAGTGAARTNLLDLQANGTSNLTVSSAGLLRAASLAVGQSSIFHNFNVTGAGLGIRSDWVVRWYDGPNLLSGGTYDVALARDQAGVLAVTNGSTGTGYLKQTPVAVSALPAAATVGAGTRGFVSDSTVAASGNFGATVTGGGSNNVPVFSDGTNWLIG